MDNSLNNVLDNLDGPHAPLAWVVLGVFLLVGIAQACSHNKRVSLRRHGREGERRVRRELARLPGRDCIAVHDLMLSTPGGGTAQIDHVAVTSRGIFVIETKSHRGRIDGAEHAQYWQQHRLMSSQSLYNPLLQNAVHLRAVRRVLRGVPESWFVSAVVFTDAWRVDVAADDIVQPRRWLPDRRTRRTFDPARSTRAPWWRRSRGVQLDPSTLVMRLDSLRAEIKRRRRIIERHEIEEIARRLAEADIRDRSDRRQHVRDAQRASERSLRAISDGICPRCGSPLSMHEGRHGPFLSCTAYPQCRFTMRT